MAQRAGHLLLGRGLGDLSLVIRTHVLEGENQRLQVVL